jgi:hypothetical protein
MSTLGMITISLQKNKFLQTNIQTSHCNIIHNSKADLTLDVQCSNWLSPLSISFDLIASTTIRNVTHNSLMQSICWRVMIILLHQDGARRGALGWGIVLQAARSPVRFPMRSLDFFNWPNPSGCHYDPGSTQPLTEMSTRNLPGGKGRPACRADNFTAIYEPLSRNCESLGVSQPYGPPHDLLQGQLYIFWLHRDNKTMVKINGCQVCPFYWLM